MSIQFIKKIAIPVAFLILLIAIDQFTKYLAVLYLMPIGEYVLIEGVFSLLYLENAGMAFGLLQGGRWIFVVVTVFALGFMAFYYITMPHSRYHTVLRAFLLMLAGGGIGNFIDRLLNGFVVDFLYFSLIDFPVFNVADIFIVVGTIGIGIMVIFIKEPQVSQNRISFSRKIKRKS